MTRTDRDTQVSKGRCQNGSRVRCPHSYRFCQIIVHLKLTIPLTLPAASCALSEKLCLPLLSGPGYNTGLEQTLNAELSSWHRKMTPACASVKLKLALVW